VSTLPVPVRVGLVLFAALLVQLSVVSRLMVGGVSGDVLVVLAVAGGFVAGPERGAAIGFAIGVGMDLLLTTPLGLTAIVYTVVGYGSGLVASNLIRSSRLTVVALVAFAAPAAIGAWVVIGALFGQTFLLHVPLGRIAVMHLLVAVLAIPLVLPAMRWATADVHTRLRHRP
jgi:rod shape-determining protein MreD